MREIFVGKSFESKSVFVTGATGFVGKVLVEKLLKSCGGIENVFVLLRPKKGENLNVRFESFKNHLAFEKLKKSDPSALKKLVPVEGDLMVSPFAGISDESITILKEKVNFVFHCAASVRFDEPLETALKINLISTRNMMDLAAKFSTLDAFIHVSTAFSNTNHKVIYEKIYEPIFDYATAIEYVEQNRTDDLEQLSQLMKKTFPNTYIFSKNLTEQLVSDRAKHLPTAIVRPSIICPSIEEPYPGWVDSINGPMGVLIGASSGLLRTVHGDGNIKPDLIPCDFVANTIIVAGASVASRENKDLQIYNCTSSKQMPITWNHFLDLSREIYKKYPSTQVVWFPDGRMCSNYVFYLFYYTLFQLLPAYFFDLCLLIAGKKTWVVKLQKRIFESLKVFEYFLNSSWEWENKNFENLHKLVSMHERSIFNFDIATLDYYQYIMNWIMGSRRFLLKLEDKSLPEAKRKYFFLFWLDLIVKFVFYAGVGYFVYKSYFADTKANNENSELVDI